MTDYPDYFTPEHHALTIYQQGVPLARKPTNVGFFNNALAGGGSVALFSGQAVDQPSFQSIVYLTQQSAAATVPFGELTFTWFDAASGQGGPSDTPILAAGNLTQCKYLITGPCRGDHLTLSLNNLDPAQQLSYAVTLTQVSHVYDQLRIQEFTNVAVPGFTRPGTGPGVGVLGSIGVLLAVSSHLDRLALAWAGEAILAVDNSAGTVPVLVQLLDPGAATEAAALYGTAGTGLIAAVEVAGGQAVDQLVSLPAGPVLIREANASATTTVTPTTTLTRIDF